MLSPYTVLDLTDDRGELAAMVLGDLGANVIKVEPPQGSPSRKLGPFIEDAPEEERSLHYFAFNRNKRGVTLDFEADEGRQAFLSLVEKTDFIIESAPPLQMSRQGLGFDALRQVNPRLIYVAITPYGQDGPHAEFAASDLTLAAMGGPMSLQGHADRPPVRLTVPQVWLHASAEAAVGALTAHARMLSTGEAQFVDVAAQTAMTWTMLQGMAAHAIQGYDFNRAGPNLQVGQITVNLVFQCSDGYVVLFPFGAPLVKLIDLCVESGLVPEEWLEDEDWPVYHFKLLRGEPVAHAMEEVLAPIRQYLLDKSKAQLLEQSLREGISIAPVSNIEELAHFRHLEERDYWLKAPLPNGREALVPGIFARSSVKPMHMRLWPPKLGEHNAEVLGGLLGLSPGFIAKATGK